MRTFKVALAFTLAVAMVGCGKKNDSAMENNTGTGTGTGDSAAMGANSNTGTTPPPPPPPAPNVPAMTDENIFAKMGMTDSVEIAAAKMALTKTKSADVKEFANMMVNEHGKMKTGGTALAKSLGITPMPMPDDPGAAQMAAMMQQLGSVPDAEAFDRMYVDQMVMSHQATLDFLGRAATEAKNDSLRAFIQKGQPVVQMHLQHAQDLRGKLASAPVSK